MDNFHIHVVGEGLPSLVRSLEIALMHGAGPAEKASGFAMHHTAGLIFVWGRTSEREQRLVDGSVVQTFPVPLGAEDIARVAWLWLEQAAGYPKEPAHDGDNDKGWMLTNDCPGPGSICAVRGAWAEKHK